MIKKLILIFGLLFAFQTQTVIMAQLPDDDEEVVFSAILGVVFDLVITDGDMQTATFISADDYNFGVSETQGNPGIDPGYSIVTMEATGNWKLKISAPDFLPNTGTGSIPINNLGVWCQATGVHQFGTEVACLYQTADAALGLLNTDIILIDLATGSSNSGTSTDNIFRLNWLMGTMQGSMNTESMFIQLSAGIFSQGIYNTTVVLTMSESL
jgi:hypothetical protein